MYTKGDGSCAKKQQQRAAILQIVNNKKDMSEKLESDKRK